MKKETFSNEQLTVMEIYIELELTKFSNKKKDLYSEIQKRTKHNLNTITSWIRRYLEKYKKIREELQEEKNARICNFEGLTEKQSKYIMFRMCGFGKKEAKTKAGYSEKTKVANIEKNPKVANKLIELRKDLFSDVRYGVATIRERGINGVDIVEYTDASTPDGHEITKTVTKQYQYVAAVAAAKTINDILGYKVSDELKIEEAKKKEKEGQLVLIE